jgi:pseudo-rSAM protein
VIGNFGKFKQCNNLLSFWDKHLSTINILCSYKDITYLQPAFKNNFSCKVSVDSPIDIKQWNKSMQALLRQDLSLEFVFNVTSSGDCQQVEQLIEQYQIEKYSLKPKYTGENIVFFRENVFLAKEDILSTSMSIKDFFSKQSINMHDFGKINIMPNGDAYANVKHPALGNIYVHSIHEIVQKELDEGRSWLRIRNQAPCNTCIYQWLCPSPSDYEIAIGRPNLCHVEQ